MRELAHQNYPSEIELAVYHFPHHNQRIDFYDLYNKKVAVLKPEHTGYSEHALYAIWLFKQGMR